MRHDALDSLVVVVGRGRWLGEHILRVEDVQALVLHRAHVEVVDGDDHVDVEVVLEPVGFLVPLHGCPKRCKGVLALVRVVGLYPDFEGDLSARRCRERAAMADQVACNQRKEIAGLAEGILPLNPVAPARKLALPDPVAVGEQHRVRCAIRFDARRESRHDVGPVQVIGDPSEAFRLALRTERVARRVEAHQLGVVVGADQHLGFELEAVRRGRYPKALRIGLKPGSIERGAVEPHRAKLELVAV